MSERLHWRGAEEAVVWLRRRPSDHRALLLLARLPLADAKVLEWLSGVRGGTIIYRSLTRLKDAELIAHVTPPAERGSSPQRFYLTDLGLATLAIERGLEVGEMARKHHLRGPDLVGLLPRLAQLAALYDMLGALACSHTGGPTLLAWERPWHCRYRSPAARAPAWITLPALAALSWSGQASTYFLLPDLGTFPPEIYRSALTRLLQLRRHERRHLPPLLIATEADRGITAWRDLLEEVRRARFDIPLAAHLFEWEELHTGLKRLGGDEGILQTSAGCLTRSISIQPLQPRRPTSPVPRIVGAVLADPIRVTEAGARIGLIALALTPADYQLLSVVACHPFLPPNKLAVVLGWPADTLRRRQNRLVHRDLMRLVEPEEIGRDARLQLVEVTRVGLELVAAYRGLSLPVAIRQIGFTGGGPNDPIGSRTKLLWNLAHTLGVDELFVSLYALARHFAEAGGDDAILEWQNATACSHRYLRPDGYGIYRRNGRRFGFFLEFDRGTMNRRDYFKKLSAYYDYATSRRFERDYHGYPTILIVTTSNGAEERIARVVQAAGTGRSISLPIFLTCRWRIDDPANPCGLLEHVWRRPKADFRDRCCWLPASAIETSRQTEPPSATRRNRRV